MPLAVPGSCHHSQVTFSTLQKTACVDCRVMHCPARLLNGQQIRPTREGGWPLIKQLGHVPQRAILRTSLCLIHLCWQLRNHLLNLTVTEGGVINHGTIYSV
jgi:hypothetical protein